MDLQAVYRQKLNDEAIKRDKQALKELLESENGRWFLTRLIERFSEISFSNSEELLYKQGKCSVVRDIKTDIEVYFGSRGKELLLKGQQEALDLEKKYQSLYEKEIEDGY